MNIRKFFLDYFYCFYARYARHINIHHHHIRISLLHFMNEFIRIGKRTGTDHTFGIIDQLLQALAKLLIIFK